MTAIPNIQNDDEFEILFQFQIMKKTLKTRENIK